MGVKNLFQSLIFCGSSDTFSLDLAPCYQFSYSLRCDNVKYVSKPEEIFSEKESMIGILGKKTELEEYLPILKLFDRE